jgi:hypothetical protein
MTGNSTSGLNRRTKPVDKFKLPTAPGKCASIVLMIVGKNEAGNPLDMVMVQQEATRIALALDKRLRTGLRPSNGRQNVNAIWGICITTVIKGWLETQ